MKDTVTSLVFRGIEVLVDQESGAPAEVTEKTRDFWSESSLVLDVLDARGGQSSAMSLRPETDAPDGMEWRLVRSFVGQVSGPMEKKLLTFLALFNWRINARHCGRCGSPMVDKQDERARICPSCAVVVYPRISPAIVAVVRKEDRILLARNAMFKNGIFSLVAGFVDPGENFEECVAREVLEETGIVVRDPWYQASQAWPFPESIMVGFEAAWESGEIHVDGKEIVEAGWFCPDDHPPLPMPGSLSRALIDKAFRR